MEGSWTFASLNSRLERNKEEEETRQPMTILRNRTWRGAGARRVPGFYLSRILLGCRSEEGAGVGVQEEGALAVLQLDRAPSAALRMLQFGFRGEGDTVG